MPKELKTNAMRFLDKSKIAYTVQTYECEEFIDGLHTAEALGQPAEQTFKTLVAHGKSGSYYCFLLPVAEELDLKKAAKSVGEKSVELLHVKDITAVTGYVRGGCTAETMELFYISGGRIGTQIRLSPTELVRAIRGKFEDIIMA